MRKICVSSAVFRCGSTRALNSLSFLEVGRGACTTPPPPLSLSALRPFVGVHERGIDQFTSTTVGLLRASAILTSFFVFCGGRCASFCAG